MKWPKLGSFWSAHHAPSFVLVVIGYALDTEQVLVEIKQIHSPCLHKRNDREYLPLSKYFDWYYPICFKTLQKEK